MGKLCGVKHSQRETERDLSGPWVLTQRFFSCSCLGIPVAVALISISPRSPTVKSAGWCYMEQAFTVKIGYGFDVAYLAMSCFEHMIHVLTKSGISKSELWSSQSRAILTAWPKMSFEVTLHSLLTYVHHSCEDAAGGLHWILLSILRTGLSVTEMSGWSCTVRVSTSSGC